MRTPFGNPDGSRADINELMEEFVNFDISRFGPGLGIQKDDLSIRIIVGAKGSGKTVYLRRLQAAAVENKSIYADYIQQELPTTGNIVRFCQAFTGQDLGEKWMQLWYCAILRSLISHLLFAEKLNTTTEEKNILKFYMPKLYPEFQAQVSIYSQVTQIIANHHTSHQYAQYFDAPEWAELQSILGELIREKPTIYFFVDSVDEEYASAPMFWLQCQQGLFYRTMRFLRDPQLGAKLHVISCVRDHVLASVYRSEHATRYRGEPHIQTLIWDWDSVKYFLLRKISRLDDEYLMKPGADNIMERWLGLSKIHNAGRNIEEDLFEYLLRHTRLLPRDIVQLGNLLCEKIRKYKQAGSSSLPSTTLRDTVREAAKGFGDEQLRICANQVTSDLMPDSAGRREFSGFYTGDSEYVRSNADTLREVLRSIGKDRFTEEELRLGQEIASEEFGKNIDVFSVLWQNQLIGFVEEVPGSHKESFFSGIETPDFLLPKHKREYIMHSCLIDAVGVEAVGNRPVGLPRERGEGV